MFRAFFDGSYLPPHGYCLLWQPELLWTHIIADATIAAAYFSIPVALVLVVRRRRDLSYGWIFWCFAVFITACGFTHVMSIWTLYQGVYGLEALVKVITALASILTAGVLWPLLPKIIALPSPGKLQAANNELAALVRERDAALEQLRGQIAQREQAETALLQSQKLEAVGYLTGGIAHDFNNLLQAVGGNLELIARKPDQEESIVRWSANALDAVQRGRSLTGQLLAFSRKQRLDLSAVRLSEVIAGTRDLIEKAVAPLSKVEIGRIDPLWTVEADPLQLELAILNLAVNARDAMPDGGTLKITASRCDGSAAPDLAVGDYVALSISDTGVGMSPEVAARALEPFFTTKEVGKGTGMGLSMVFGVLRQSHGSLRIDSEPGKGTCVTLFLRMSARGARRGAGDADMPDSRVSLSGTRIAMIDDDDQVRMAIADTLRSAGAEVMEAGDGPSGIDLVRRQRPDLVVLDFAMPGMSGSEVARRLRADDAGLRVLVVTGFAESAAFDTIPGAVSVLRKPFESRELLRRVAEMLGV